MEKVKIGQGLFTGVTQIDYAEVKHYNKLTLEMLNKILEEIFNERGALTKRYNKMELNKWQTSINR